MTCLLLLSACDGQGAYLNMDPLGRLGNHDLTNRPATGEGSVMVSEDVKDWLKFLAEESPVFEEARHGAADGWCLEAVW